MSYLDDLFKQLNEMELDEKITSKRAALKQKLRAKRRAEKKAEKKIEKKASETKTKETKQQTALAIYDEKALEIKDFSEAFKTLRELIVKFLEQYYQEYTQAEEEFKRAGESNSQIHEKYVAALTNLKNALTQFTENEYPKYVDQITDLEYEQVNNFLNAVSKYVENQEQANNLLVTTKEDVTDVADVEEDQILSLEDKLLGNKEQKSKRDKATVKIITYADWAKQVGNKFDTFGQMLQGIKKAFYNIGVFVNNLTAVLWNPIVEFFNIPVARDFLKTFMLANPFTAMLFNGDFGKFDLKIPVRKNYEDTKLDKQGIPQDIDKLKTNQIKKEFYTNKKLINHINNLYNTELTSIKEKADLKKKYLAVHNSFKKKLDDKTIKNNFSSLINLVNNLGNELNWDFEDRTGTTDKQEDKINKQIKARIEKKKETQEESFEEFITKINNTLNEAIQ